MIVLKYNKSSPDTNVERVEATVKWYNPTKGYGFLSREDNSGDIMIHFSVLHKVECPYIKLGDRVICDVVSGKSGDQVSQVIEVKYGSPEPRSLSSYVDPRITPIDPESLEEIEGSIKWFNPEKGFGFICPADGGREIFIHYFVIRAAGCKSLQPGIRVLAKVFNSERGPEARSIRILYQE